MASTRDDCHPFVLIVWGGVLLQIFDDGPIDALGAQSRVCVDGWVMRCGCLSENGGEGASERENS